VNRSAKCPSCNHETSADQLTKNKHADRLGQIVQKQKDVASKLYFERLIAGAGAGGVENLTASQTEILVARKLSPVEQLFQEHMTKSLQVYERFLDDINKKCEAAKQAIKAEYVEKMEAASRKPKSDDELSEKVAALAARCESSCARLDKGRAESERLLLEQFAAHLVTASLVPERLPCVVRARLARRNANECVRVTLRPADTCADALRTAFAARQRERGDPVLAWPDDAQLRFVLQRLTSAPVDLKPDVALGTQGMENDCEIVIHGPVVLESEKPHKCFASTFVAGAVVDYFSCKECNLKWICKDCSTHCHSSAGHTLSVFAEKHAPSWACCYWYE
jgi:hypothetical protein